MGRVRRERATEATAEELAERLSRFSQKSGTRGEVLDRELDRDFDRSTLRSLEELAAAFAFCKSRCKQGAGYAWTKSRLQQIRLELQVHGEQGSLAIEVGLPWNSRAPPKRRSGTRLGFIDASGEPCVQVLECHCRIAIETGDDGEVSRTLGTLRGLYAVQARGRHDADGVTDTGAGLAAMHLSGSESEASEAGPGSPSAGRKLGRKGRRKRARGLTVGSTRAEAQQVRKTDLLSTERQMMGALECTRHTNRPFVTTSKNGRSVAMPPAWHAMGASSLCPTAPKVKRGRVHGLCRP